ncbi:MAG TPA: hypothetical protein VMF03_19995 [Steroidobacteraceae bacterium]|nr:hypothetical protein [Steroidobacteraceae bacterium]
MLGRSPQLPDQGDAILSAEPHVEQDQIRPGPFQRTQCLRATVRQLRGIAEVMQRRLQQRAHGGIVVDGQDDGAVLARTGREGSLLFHVSHRNIRAAIRHFGGDGRL